MPVVCFHCKYPRLREKAPSSLPRFKHPIFSKQRLPTVHCLWHRCYLYFLISAHDVWSRCRFYGLHNSHKSDRSDAASVAILMRDPAGTLVRFTTVIQQGQPIYLCTRCTWHNRREQTPGSWCRMYHPWRLSVHVTVGTKLGQKCKFTLGWVAYTQRNAWGQN